VQSVPDLQATSQPDPTVEPEHGTLLRLAGAYTRQALQFPDELRQLRALVAELMLELRMQDARIAALERRNGGRP
jgi:hypothetical protein